MPAGYWPSRWPAEDGGPTRRQVPHGGGGLGLGRGGHLEVHWREVPAATMAVQRQPGELYLLRHTGGGGAVSWVERVDPESLEPLERSPDLAGGPVWPGGLAAHANGTLYVVFGDHAHRLAPDGSPLARRRLPRERPYNSFVVLPDGVLVTKDFAKDGDRPSELVVLEPDGLEVVARLDLPERSIARLSADGSTVYAVGDTHLFALAWDGAELTLDGGRFGPYRTLAGQSYGWDAVLEGGAAWFLDDGEGTERYTGSFAGRGLATAPLHLVRCDLASGEVTLSEICPAPGGIVANPPVLDPAHGIVVGYDSGNGVLAGFGYDETGVTGLRWRRSQHHGGHLLCYPETGELVTGDYDAARGMDQVVVLDTATGRELARADTASPVQSVLFPAPGFGRDLYLTTFTTFTRVTVVEDGGPGA